MNKVKDYTLALRPWSFTAAIVPIMVTAAVTGSDLSSISFVRALTMGITVQAGANLTNTYYDYKNKVKTFIVDETDIISAPFVYTLPNQLIAYHIALLKGTDVDQPRNLAKSVTVE